MRFPIAYYLLLLYLTVMLRPLLPVLCDVWDHTFAESIHIATVHAKYGANHLQSALVDNAAENNSNSKAQNTVKPTEDVPVHLLTNNHTQFIAQTKGKAHRAALHNAMVAAGFMRIFAPPPKPCL